MFSACVCVVLLRARLVTPAVFRNYYIISLAAHCEVIMAFCETESEAMGLVSHRFIRRD